MTPCLTRAAEILDEFAVHLHEVHCTDGEWSDYDDYHPQSLCDEYRQLANRLRKMKA